MFTAMIIMKKTPKKFKLIPIFEFKDSKPVMFDLPWSNFYRYDIENKMELLEVVAEDMEDPTLFKLFKAAEKRYPNSMEDCTILPATSEIPTRIIVKWGC